MKPSPRTTLSVGAILRRTIFVSGVIAQAYFGSSNTASACGGVFDVKCNLQHGGLSPGNIAKQTGKAWDDSRTTVEKAGRDVDRWRLQLQSTVLTGPALAAWFQQSRNDAARGAMPIPPSIRQQLEGKVDQGALNSATYKVGDGGALNLSHMSIQIGDAAAVTLIDVIVFRGPTEANDLSTWVHELKHVEQFRRWGVNGFAQRYMESWNSVENEAYAAQNQYVANQISQPAPQQIAQPGLQSPDYRYPQYLSQVCVTPAGACNKPPSPQGISCSCPSPYGWVNGVAR